MFVALMSLSLAACATDDSTYGGDVLPGKTVQKALCPTGCNDDVNTTLTDTDWIQIGAGAYQRADTVVEGSASCQVPAGASGACAFACEPDKFAETIPLGTCAAVHCAFPNGPDVLVGGCHR